MSAAREYTIEQFPKNKRISGLSADQSELRVHRKYIYGKKLTCRQCNRKQPIAEYYIRDKRTGRRAVKCRDCQIKNSGCLNVGALRFAKKIFKKGFRRCSVCKEIKPLSQFSKNKGGYGGINNNCKQCSYVLHKGFQEKQVRRLSVSYVRDQIKKVYGGWIPFNDKFVKKFRAQMLLRRSEKYFIDGKGFVTVRAFAKYIESTHTIPVTTTEMRLRKGWKGADLLLSEFEARSRAHKKM